MNSPLLAPLAGPIGHLVDLTRLGLFKYGAPHSFTKFRQILAAKRLTGARVLVETGTFKGVTTSRCLPHFEMVYTIELDSNLAAAAKQRFRRSPKCVVLQGDAMEEVGKLIGDESLGRDILFFLDGHFSGGVTAVGEKVEPALDVLLRIAEQKPRVAGIIVDDFREFGTQRGWPSKAELIGLAESLFGDFEIMVHLDQLLILRKRAAS